MALRIKSELSPDGRCDSVGVGLRKGSTSFLSLVRALEYSFGSDTAMMLSAIVARA